MSKKIIIFSLITIFLIGIVFAFNNPSVSYCEGMGYKYSTDGEGGKGVCTLPDGKQVDAWKFLEGKIVSEYGFCERQGYESTIISDEEKCSIVFSSECLACIVDGEEIEVISLINSKIEEGVSMNEGYVINVEKETFGVVEFDDENGRIAEHIFYFILGILILLIVVIGFYLIKKRNNFDSNPQNS